jgi:hypothetical protein
MIYRLEFVYGEGDAGMLGSAAIHHLSAAEIPPPLDLLIDDLGETPGEIEALPAEERSVAIIEMAAPRPGETCGRCNAVVPPHLAWCPWDVGGHEEDWTETAVAAGANTARRTWTPCPSRSTSQP